MLFQIRFLMEWFRTIITNKWSNVEMYHGMNGKCWWTFEWFVTNWTDYHEWKFFLDIFRTFFFYRKSGLILSTRFFPHTKNSSNGMVSNLFSDMFLIQVHIWIWILILVVLDFWPQSINRCINGEISKIMIGRIIDHKKIGRGERKGEGREGKREERKEECNP